MFSKGIAVLLLSCFLQWAHSAEQGDIESQTFREPALWIQILAQPSDEARIVLAIDWSERVSHHLKVFGSDRVQKGRVGNQWWIDVVFWENIPTKKGTVFFKAGVLAAYFYPEDSKFIIFPFYSPYQSKFRIVPFNENYDEYQPFPFLIDQLLAYSFFGSKEGNDSFHYKRVIAVGPQTLLADFATYFVSLRDVAPGINRGQAASIQSILSSVAIDLFSLAALENGQPSPVREFRGGLLPQRPMATFCLADLEHEANREQGCMARQLKALQSVVIKKTLFPSNDQDSEDDAG